MKIHNEVQGSPEWLALRGLFKTASEAPAMMGDSKYQTRNELLALKKTGVAPDVSSATQRLFDNGHATEALARVIVECDIGEDMFPVVGSDGELLASVDGMTMLGDALFEHKAYNAKLAMAVQAGELEPHYYWQLEQQLLVTGAEKVIFVCSDGTKDNWAQMEYRAVPGRAEKLLAGWKQFDADLAEFVPVEAAPVVIGATPDELPALRIELTGMVTASNLKVFEDSALAVIGAVKTDLQTDQDFADAKKAVKWCGDVEAAVAEAKRQALSQTESIDKLFKSLDRISANARETRLKVDKMVKAQELSIKIDIKQKAEDAFGKHVEVINARLGRVTLPAIAADFAGAMKGKRNLESMRDAVDTELARVKIEANAIAEGIEANLKTLRELAPDHVFLFRDAQQIITKANDDFTLLVKSRLDEHDLSVKAAAKKVEDDRIEADRVEALRVAEAARITAIPAVVQAPVEAAAPVVETKPAFELVKERTVEQEVLPLKAAPAHRVTVVIEGTAETISIGMAMLGGRVTAFYDFDCSGVILDSVAY